MSNFKNKQKMLLLQHYSYPQPSQENISCYSLCLFHFYILTVMIFFSPLYEKYYCYNPVCHSTQAPSERKKWYLSFQVKYYFEKCFIYIHIFQSGYIYIYIYVYIYIFQIYIPYTYIDLLSDNYIIL
jgi:hypothetical protein